jgi:cell division protein DivIC
MKLFRYIPSWLKNKYFNSFAAFCVIMLFLDKNDLFTQLDRKKEERGLYQQRSHFTQEINQLEQDYRGLVSDPKVIEKFAREKFFMKRDNEELFIISEKPDPVKN